VEQNTFLCTRIAEAAYKQGRYQEAVAYFTRSLEGGDHSYRTVHGMIKVLQKEDCRVSVDDHWLVTAAEFALDNKGPEVARSLLRHLSHESRESLAKPLKALL